jgi:hypothetical protein
VAAASLGGGGFKARLVFFFLFKSSVEPASWEDEAVRGLLAAGGVA